MNDAKAAAEQRLTTWAATVAHRDPVILRALLDGLSKNRIHTLTGIARTTIDDILREYPEINTAAVLRATARVHTGMTAAEFDHSLFAGDGHAVQAMNSAAYLLANEDHPEVGPDSDQDDLRHRQERADALWDRVWPEVEAMTARAKAMKFTGWSDAAKTRGEKIRYADTQPTGGTS